VAENRRLAREQARLRRVDGDVVLDARVDELGPRAADRRGRCCLRVVLHVTRRDVVEIRHLLAAPAEVLVDERLCCRLRYAEAERHARPAHVRGVADAHANELARSRRQRELHVEVREKSTIIDMTFASDMKRVMTGIDGVSKRCG
jgi:hypothetical protein